MMKLGQQTGVLRKVTSQMTELVIAGYHYPPYPRSRRRLAVLHLSTCTTYLVQYQHIMTAYILSYLVLVRLGAISESQVELS